MNPPGLTCAALPFARGAAARYTHRWRSPMSASSVATAARSVCGHATIAPAASAPSRCRPKNSSRASCAMCCHLASSASATTACSLRATSANGSPPRGPRADARTPATSHRSRRGLPRARKRARSARLPVLPARTLANRCGARTDDARGRSTGASLSAWAAMKPAPTPNRVILDRLGLSGRRRACRTRPTALRAVGRCVRTPGRRGTRRYGPSCRSPIHRWLPAAASPIFRAHRRRLKSPVARSARRFSSTRLIPRGARPRTEPRRRREG